MYPAFNQTLEDPTQILTQEQKDMAAGDIKVIVVVVLGVVGLVCLMLCFRYLHLYDQRRKRENLRRKCQLPPDLADADPEAGSIKPSTEITETQPARSAEGEGSTQPITTGAETQSHHYPNNNQNPTHPATNTAPSTTPSAIINQEASMHPDAPVNQIPPQQPQQVHIQVASPNTEDPFPTGPIGKDWTPY